MRRSAQVAVAGAALAALLLALSAAGCGSSALKLDGTSWSLTGWSVSSLDPKDFTITADFRDGSMSGKAAVNSYNAPYTLGDDGAFSLGAIAGTKMAGPEADMRAESAYLDLLAAAKKVTLNGSTLTLYDAAGNESLIYTAK